MVWALFAQGFFFETFNSIGCWRLAVMLWLIVFHFQLSHSLDIFNYLLN